MRLLNLLHFTIILLIAMSLLGCSIVPGLSVSPTPTTYTDPFAYCAAVSTIDAPDARYTGPEVPEIIAKGLQDALDAPETPLDVLTGGSFWRCMNGKVYACFVGANLPCQAKANTDRTPTPDENDFCQQNPDADVIPMAVTGRETVYEWRCKNGAPEIVRQFAEPDERGFMSHIWYELSPK